MRNKASRRYLDPHATLLMLIESVTWGQVNMHHSMQRIFTSWPWQIKTDLPASWFGQVDTPNCLYFWSTDPQDHFLTARIKLPQYSHSFHKHFSWWGQCHPRSANDWVVNIYSSFSVLFTEHYLETSAGQKGAWMGKLGIARSLATSRKYRVSLAKYSWHSHLLQDMLKFLAEITNFIFETLTYIYVIEKISIWISQSLIEEITTNVYIPKCVVIYALLYCNVLVITSALTLEAVCASPSLYRILGGSASFPFRSRCLMRESDVS